MYKCKLLLLGACLLTLVELALAQSVQFPGDAVVNILDYHSNANDGQTDATAAIQQAIDDHSIDLYRRFTIYFPAGVYLVSSPVFVDPYAGAMQGGNGKGIVLQGEGKDFTVLKLTDNNPLFQHDAAPVPVLSTAGGQTTGGWTAISFMNSVFDLTIDTGAGNPGAIGLRYIANNQGAVKRVRIRSGDPGKIGWAGIDMERASIPGPALIKNVEIIGFDYSMRIGWANYGTTVEHLVLREARRAGIRNQSHILNIRGLDTEGIDGPAIVNTNDNGVLTILDSNLKGLPGHTAIVNYGYLFARNIQVQGYGASLNDHGALSSGNLSEVRHGDLIKLWEESPDTSLRLPVLENPDPPYDPVESWVNITDFGYEPGSVEEPNYGDAGPAIRAAIAFMNSPGNEQKTTLYFEPGEYRLASPIAIYGNIKRVVGNFATIWPTPELEKNKTPVITIEPTNCDTLVIERINFAPACCEDRRRKNALFLNNSTSDVVLQHLYIGHGKAYEKGAATGRLFLEDVCALSQYYYAHTHREEVLPEAIPQFDFKDQQVWARQLDPEQRETKIAVDGGQLWILGLKTEEPGIVLSARDNARVEILGGTILPSFPVSDGAPVIRMENAEGSFILAEHAGINNFNRGGYYKRIIEESRGQEHRQIDRGETPQRLQDQNTPVFVLPLYVAHGGPRAQPGYRLELPDSLDFGEVAIGKSGFQAFAISNAGNSSLHIEEIIYPEGYSGHTGPLRLPAGEEAQITVTFSPVGLGAYAGRITVLFKTGTGLDSAAAVVTGRALPSRIIRLSGVLSFPDTPAGQTSEKVLTVNNEGLGSLHVSAIELPAGFRAQPEAFSVSPGERREVAVYFAPLQAGIYAGLLEVHSDATAGNQILNVAGRGLGEPVAVKTDLSASVFSLFPNPVEDAFRVAMENDLSGDLEISITSVAGEQVLKAKKRKTGRRAEWSFRVDGWTAGLYVLEVRQNATRLAASFLIQE
jgi:hypothetical protein